MRDTLPACSIRRYKDCAPPQLDHDGDVVGGNGGTPQRVREYRRKLARTDRKTRPAISRPQMQQFSGNRHDAIMPKIGGGLLRPRYVRRRRAAKATMPSPQPNMAKTLGSGTALMAKVCSVFDPNDGSKGGE